jgi:FkbM family methyltransferase
MLRQAQKLLRYKNLLGARQGLRWFLIRIGNRLNLISGVRNVRNPPGAQYPVVMRVGGSSDPAVFDQIFINSDLAVLTSHVRDARVIVDLGANVGYSSIVLLNAFPNAFVLAVEPDPSSVAICSRNLEPYGDRARLVKAGIWNRSCSLKLVRGEFGDGKEWATQVRPTEAGETADVEALDMPSLLGMCPHPTIDILKIDIEGAEATLFGEGAEDWLKRVRNFCVEIHSAEAASVVDHAMQKFRFDVLQSGEYMVFLNLTAKSVNVP